MEGDGWQRRESHLQALVPFPQCTRHWVSIFTAAFGEFAAIASNAWWEAACWTCERRADWKHGSAFKIQRGTSHGKGKQAHTDTFPKEADFRKPVGSKPGAMACSCNPSTRETEAGGLKFETRLSYILRPHLKTKQNKV